MFFCFCECFNLMNNSKFNFALFGLVVWFENFYQFFCSCCDIFKRLASLLTRVTSSKSPKLQSVSKLVSDKGRQWSDLCPIKLNRNDTEQVPGSNHHLSPSYASAPSSLSKSAGHHRESNPLKQQIAKFSISCSAFIASLRLKMKPVIDRSLVLFYFWLD